MKKKQRITDQGLGETVKVKQKYKITKKKIIEYKMFT